MYTNIPTEDCIETLTAHLLSTATFSRFRHYPPKALVAAIGIVMRNNRMRFGDLIVLQKSGPASRWIC